MRRTTFDALLTVAGLGLAVILLVAGGLLMWGYTFTNGQVHDQLVSQKIFFPAHGSTSLTELPAADRAAMEPYAGQQMVDGKQAEVYANHYIAVHLGKIGGGQTYSQLSAQALKQPNNAKLAGQVDTMFRGTTLRGMLLNAYAFWQIGQIALIGAIVSFAGAALMLVLSGLGIWHLRRTTPEAEVFAGLGTHAKTPA
ncbi:MAG: hypothetical protein ACM3ML_33630 [Micromonosporaceae bacterium]